MDRTNLHIITGADPRDPPMKREDSLLPGMVRTPAQMVRLTDDWGAPGSWMWGEDPRQQIQTPLTGYGHQSDVWGSGTASPLMPNDETAYETAGSIAVDPLDAVSAVAAATLKDLPPQDLPYTSTAAFSTNAIPMNQHYTSSSPFVVGQPQETRVHHAYGPLTEGQREVHHQQRVPYTSPQRPTKSDPQQSYIPLQTQGMRTLEDRDVAHSIIASAGLPLSMRSLLDYIREGQMHLANTGGMTATTNHRNFPNLSEPPVGPGAPHSLDSGAPQGDGNRGSGNSGGRGSRTGGRMRSYTASATNFPHQQQKRHGNYSDDGGWDVEASDLGNGGMGGWNVRADCPSQQPYASTPGTGCQHQGYRTARSSNVPHAQPTMPLQRRQSFTNEGLPLPVTQPQQAAYNTRPKSESEILSDLLHFHANFFPPPPPPRVPAEARRHRAALWYHYASKWDITHRLPPPPRTPLPEMELEYLHKLPTMTRVPYHGDGWLRMSERWFEVMQRLFDYPEENVGMEVDAAVILAQAVIS